MNPITAGLLLTLLLLSLCWDAPRTQLLQDIDTVSLSDAVHELAARGSNFGVIVALQNGDSEELLPLQSFFQRTRPLQQRRVPNQPAREVLASIHPAAVTEAEGIPILRDPAAAFCGELLEQIVPFDIESTPEGTCMKALAQVTGQQLSEGLVGSCMPASVGLPERRFVTKGGRTLLSVLSSAAARQRGTGWVAVEARGSCSFGLVEVAASGSVCLVTMGQPVTAPDAER